MTETRFAILIVSTLLWALSAVWGCAIYNNPLFTTPRVDHHTSSAIRAVVATEPSHELRLEAL